MHRNTRHAGFTLLELLVVMVIIGLLAGYVGPRFFSQIGKSEVKAARAQIDGLEKALDQYRLDNGRYPTTEEGLKALTERPSTATKWSGPYLKKAVPLEVKVGARATPIANLGINLDFVYQGWNSIDQLLLTPENVTLENGGTTSPIPPFGVKKNWMATWSVRLGASYKVIKYLSVSLGGLYETGAAPSSTYSVDWTHPSRFIFTGGLTGHLGPIDVIAGALFTPTNTTVVTDSIVSRGQTGDPAVYPPGVVGNGIYTSGGYGFIFGVRGNFGAVKPAAEPVKPASAPAVEPAAS